MVVNGDAVTLMLTGVERYATLNADFKSVTDLPTMRKSAWGVSRNQRAEVVRIAVRRRPS